MSKKSLQIPSGASDIIRNYGMKFKVISENNSRYSNIAPATLENLDTGYSIPNLNTNEACADGIPEADDRNKSEAVIRFTIGNLKELKESTFSSTSYARNLPWRIMIQPSVKQKRIPVQHFLGVFLHCNNKTDKQSWACYVHAELRLLKCNQSLPPYVKKIQHLFTPKKNYCGFYYFILIDDVLNSLNGFIKNDTITLEAHVVADEPWSKTLPPKINESAFKSYTPQSKKSVSYQDDYLVTKKSFIEEHESAGKPIEELFHISDEKLEGGTTSVNVLQYLKDVKIREPISRDSAKTEQGKDSDNDDAALFEDCEPSSQHNLEKVLETNVSKTAKKPELLKPSKSNIMLDTKCSFTAREAKLRMLISEQSFIDRQKEELRSKMNDLDEAKTCNMMTTISLLEEKIALLEKQVETEEKKRMTQQAKNYKLERRVKELEKELEKQYKKAENQNITWLEKRRQLEEKVIKLEKIAKEESSSFVKADNKTEPMYSKFLKNR